MLPDPHQPGFHPVIGLLYLAGGTVAAMICGDPLLLFALALGAVGVLVATAGAKPGARCLVPALGMLVPVVVINALFHPAGETVVLRLPFLGGGEGRPITVEGLRFALFLWGRLVVVVALGAAFPHLVKPDAFLQWISRRLPRTGIVGLVTLLTLPRMRRDLDRVSLVMEARGVRFPARNLWLRTLASVPLWRALLLGSLEGSLETAEALHVRGFGTGARTTLRPIRFRGRDGVAFLSLAGGVALFLVAGREDPPDPGATGGGLLHAVLAVGIVLLFVPFFRGARVLSPRSVPPASRQLASPGSRGST